MNPEFRRQLWLQFTSTRLALMPVLLLAIFAAVALTVSQERGDALAAIGGLLFIGLVWCMGTLAAGASVMDEIADRTWDQQRMSAMQPWTMTWGKLAGASAYGWYGGLMCLLVAVPSALLGEHRSQVGHVAVGAILVGILLPALLIAINLQLVRVGGRMARRGGVWTLLLVVLWGIGPILSALHGQQVGWWNQNFDSFDFAVGSIAFFTVCALIAAWRSMAEVLAVRQLPWAWPALALLTTVYLTGFAPGQQIPLLSLIGLSTSVGLTYFALLTEPQPRPLWQRVVVRLGAGQLRAGLLQLPRWPGTLVLALLFAVCVMLTVDIASAPPTGFMKQFGWNPVCLVLLVVRDCALALFFAFAPKNRRPLLGFLVLMFVLYGLLPWLLFADGGELLLSLVLPMLGRGAFAIGVAAIHAAIALAMLRWRWMATAP